MDQAATQLGESLIELLVHQHNEKALNELLAKADLSTLLIAHRRFLEKALTARNVSKNQLIVEATQKVMTAGASVLLCEILSRLSAKLN